ncbi:MAG: S9 family peptidase, partial [Dehalococcoidia bacterium]
PAPITPEPQRPRALRYADVTLAPDGGLLLCVRERHEDGGEVVNEIVALPPDGSAEPRVVASGRDFYSSPRVSPDGTRLAWLSWDHPRMPWDGTELWTARLQPDGTLKDTRLVAGGAGESIFQPEWGPDGALYFVSDRSGWWNLYRQAQGRAEPLAPMETEFGWPQWGFGLSQYAFLSGGRVACFYVQNGEGRLGVIPPGAGRVAPLDVPLTSVGAPFLKSDGRERLWFVAGSLTEPLSVATLDVASGTLEVIKRSLDAGLDPGYVSTPQHIEFSTEGGLTAHALFYPPANVDYWGVAGELPPLLVMSHGGPTAAATSALSLATQFWTSRGFAVVDVDYGGSTGYGRAYRERLRGQWGVVDTADCINAARYLAGRGLVDRRRMAIRGGSAGGYTTLCALTFHDVFAAGASHYGVADAETLAKDTHKFEERYLDGLIGPYPEAAELYRARSPIHFADRISCPVILLQGLEDRIVPPSQAEAMVAALRRNGVPFAYLTFEGEQHGFRKAETQERALTAELYFYSRIFGFEPADPIEPVPIENL